MSHMHTWQGRRRTQEGFTLVELMVVVLVMGILMAIAIPTYLGARHRAEDRAAQENLHTAISALVTYYSDNGGSFANLSPSAMDSIEPGLSWSTTNVATAGQVAVDSTGNDSAVAVALSASGRCFWISQVETPNASIIGSSYFNSETITKPGTWYASMTPGGPNGACELGLSSPFSWSQNSLAGGW